MYNYRQYITPVFSSAYLRDIGPITVLFFFDVEMGKAKSFDVVIDSTQAHPPNTPLPFNLGRTLNTVS